MGQDNCIFHIYNTFRLLPVLITACTLTGLHLNNELFIESVFIKCQIVLMSHILNRYVFRSLRSHIFQLRHMLCRQLPVD